MNSGSMILAEIYARTFLKTFFPTIVPRIDIVESDYVDSMKEIFQMGSEMLFYETI